ncbi:MAG: CoA pyrophosphatase [Firmicutes bacterium]|nr:CoA pyrophosphatase [Bacillota bacterium]
MKETCDEIYNEELMDEGLVRERLHAVSPVTENNFRHYAVLIPLLRTPEGLRVLYEVRASDLDRQPGEICFPGGMVEEGESWADCALRETEEEIGIPAEDIELLDELTTIYGVGRFAMHCYPGFVREGAEERLDISRAEVDRVFTLSLEDLLAAEPELYWTENIQEGPEDFPYDRVTGAGSYPWARFNSPVPVYDVDGWAVWGLTGRVTKVLMEALKGEAPEGNTPAQEERKK